MRTLWLFGLSAVAVLVTAVAAGAVGSAAPAAKRTSRLTITLHATSNNILHGATTTPNSVTAKYAAADSQYWHAVIRNLAGSTVGSENSACFATTADVAICTSVDELPGGTIVHTGSASTTGNTYTDAITGGTGRYRGVTGSTVGTWQNATDAVVRYYLSWR
jgi:hypothetical protein